MAKLAKKGSIRNKLKVYIMKKSGILFLTILMIVLSVFGIQITLKALIDKDLKDLPFFVNSGNIYEVNERCTNKRKIKDASKSESELIKKLGEYQDVCDSFITDKWMIFIDMPKDSIGAKRGAQELAKEIKEFNKYNVTPIILVEPVTEWGLIDFMEFKNGLYTPWIEDFFVELKTVISEEEMKAIWVPFPEPNLPYWNISTAQPNDIGENISIYLSILKKHYPNAHGSILLNSKSYEPGDFNWEFGEYMSLLPYVETIEKDFVDSVGLQGFPWLPPQSATFAQAELDPKLFLNSDLLFEIAYFLNIKDVWFNTGTFGTKYALDSEEIVFMSPEERRTILEGIFRESYKLKRKGFNITINLFSEDKSNTPEQTNWAYWTSVSVPNKEKIIFVDFVRRVYEEGMEISLYDK
jgi:hypothetical protein